MELYQYLVKFLKENNQFLLVKFFGNSSPYQRLGALYPEDDYLRLSGMNPQKLIKEPGSVLTVAENPETSRAFSNKLLQFYEHGSLEPNELVLDWNDYYQNSLEDRGLLKKKGLRSVKKSKEAPGSELMDMLMNI